MEEININSAEGAKIFSLLKDILIENPQSLKLTDEEVKSVKNLIKCASTKIQEVKDFRAIQKAEFEKEQKRILEEEKERNRLAEEKAQIELESIRQRLEQPILADPPISPIFSTSGEPLERMFNNETNEVSTFDYDSDVLQASGNEPSVDYLSFIKEDGAYLVLLNGEVSENLSTLLRDNGLSYPLGVAYDEKLNIWLVCDKKLSKIFLLDIEKDQVIVCDGVNDPTAVTIYTEGHNAAVLCSDGNRRPQIFIYHYNKTTPYLQTFATHAIDLYDMKFELRGLAKSSSGNILSLESGPKAKRLRVFNKELGGKGFEIKGAQSPSFIATYRSTVAISDLRVNKVFIINLDDRNWERIEFNITHIIESPQQHAPLEQLANASGFAFVSGMQFDVNGFLLIGDAKGHSLKLYDTEYAFLHRISSDFFLPYVSSFHINRRGECVLLDVQGKQKLHWVKMSSIPEMLPWVASNGKQTRRPDYPTKSKRGGIQSRNN